MLQSMKLRNVGPVHDLNLELADRLNFITGDNGLGKTFLLDMAWYGLTGSWASWPARPDKGKDAEMMFGLTRGIRSCSYAGSNLEWVFPHDQPAAQGIVLYAQVDGGFSVWDPDRNALNDDRKAPAFHFTPRDLWYGLRRTVTMGNTSTVLLLCNGLLQDLVLWQARGDGQIEQFKKLLTKLSPPDEPLRLGVPMRLGNGDPREYPTLLDQNDVQTPMVHASAGVRRILSLAYLLIWAWTENTIVKEDKPAQSLLFLVDELEAHLHPRWQRTIVPCLLEVAKHLLGKDATVQFLAVTHSPLVLASLEPYFLPDQDRIWSLERNAGEVTLERKVWARLGQVGNWLAFLGVDKPYSMEAELALQQAADLVVKGAKDLAEIERVNNELSAVLGDMDPFWVGWRSWMAKRKAAS